MADAGERGRRRRVRRVRRRPGRPRPPRRVGHVVGLVALGLLAAVVLTDLRGGGSRDADREGESADSESGSTGAPVDVDEPRPTIDLAVAPDPTDAVAVGRWWAGTYTAYVAVDTPDALADRLAAVTTPELQATLRAVAPAASVDPVPTEVVGGSHSRPQADQGSGGTRLQVTVETPASVVLYDLVLVEVPGGWLVSQAERRL